MLHFTLFEEISLATGRWDGVVSVTAGRPLRSLRREVMAIWMGPGPGGGDSKDGEI